MTEVWGQLAKAQDDPQTIDEAIAAAITAHEADANAHLGSGESLEAHKASEVLDHVAGSIVADKITATELKFDTQFEDPDMVDITGDRFTPWWPGILLTVDPGGVHDSFAKLTVRGLCSKPDLTKNHLWEWYIEAGVESVSHHRFFFGNSDDETLDIGWGFKFDNSTVIAFYDDNTDDFASGSLSVDPTLAHSYRIYYDATLELLFWYVDGVEVYSHAPGEAYQDLDVGMLLRVYKTSAFGSLQNDLACYRFTIARQI